MIARLLYALAMMLATPALAQAPASQPTPIAIGETHRIASRHMGDARTVNVYLPSGYANPAKRFPVLYLIDGGLEQDFLHIAGTSQLGGIWARSEPVIVVGIETKDRRRELIGPTQDVKLLTDYPTAGFSAGFRNYIRDEVKPLIEKNYRTTGEDAVIGESLAGLFIVETFLREPSLFDRYAAVSPSLWWDQQRLSGEAAGLLKGRKKADTRLFLTIGDEGAEMQAGVDRLVDALAAHPAAAGQYCYAPRPRSTHATIYHDVSPEALQYLFPTSVDHDPKSGFVIACSKKS
ncbi:alpha/beta hydrolase [Sphingosinicella sp. LY1275]|uniref:alpha/beta hydrolase n=1 Tax=Sphingosinicella sp. LY1275 TaxID=3095379 RepID=UPI002ADED488|nr:alpha/beta hydrolase-fold protein [Sphingosinicella sp. LY1275]MEA1015018.1 alpha/beta hydrolase-fold protein [Sphingosinicella sp. LY1275]